MATQIGECRMRLGRIAKQTAAIQTQVAWIIANYGEDYPYVSKAAVEIGEMADHIDNMRNMLETYVRTI